MATLLIERHRFHTARVREERREEFNVDNIVGRDVFEFAQEMLQAGVSFSGGPVQTTVTSVQLRGSRGLLVTAETGQNGQNGTVRDSETGQGEFTIQPHHLAGLSSRMLLLAPPKTKVALAIHEVPGSRAAGVECTRFLKREWGARDPGATWVPSWAQTGEQFLQEADLKAIEVRRSNQHLASHRGAEEPVRMSYMATARRGHFFKKNLIDQLLDSPETANTLLEIGQRQDEDETLLHLRSGDVSKSYMVSRGDLPRVRIKIDSGLTDDEFVSRCVEEARADQPRLHWDSNWCS